MPFFTSADFKRLKKDLRTFMVDANLDPDERNYGNKVLEAVEYIDGDMDNIDHTERIEFQWPRRSEKVITLWHWLEDWNEKRFTQNASRGVRDPEVNSQGAGAQIQNRTSTGRSTQEPLEQANGHAQNHASSNRDKRPAEDNPEENTTEGLRNPIIDFHLQLLQSLLKDRQILANRILILRHALRVVEAGADVKLVEWHVEDIKRQMPDNEEILEAADLLFECIKFTNIC